MALLPTRRTPSVLDDKLIPLINIVFLLLIFFMIGGQITKPENLDIEVPVSASEKPLPPSSPLLELETGGILKFDGHVTSLEQLASALRAGSRTGPLTTPITLKADKRILASELDAVLSVLKREGVTSVTLYSQNKE